MATRPMSRGLSYEIDKKIKSKYSVELEQKARRWIETILDEPLSPDADPDTPLGMLNMHKCLKDGQILVRLMNKLNPGSLKMSKIKGPFASMENIENFLKAARKYGVHEDDLFETPCLYEKTNMTMVIDSIFALGRAAQKNCFQGPVLGVKEATPNKRQFSEEQLRAGQNIIGLQMGTNRTANQSGVAFGKIRSIIDL